MYVTLEWPDSVPATEFNRVFLQGMLDRMAVSYAKYGAVADAYPHKVHALESLQVRVGTYLRTGNTEYLMDAANYAMIEFMAPRLAEAEYRPTDRSGSPGRKWHGEINPHQARNIPERMD